MGGVVHVQAGIMLSRVYYNKTKKQTILASRKIYSCHNICNIKKNCSMIMINQDPV